GAFPEARAEVKRGSAGKAPLRNRKKGVRTAVMVRVQRRKGALPAGDVGELPVSIPPLVVDVVLSVLGQHFHQRGLLIRSRLRSAVLGKRGERREEYGQHQNEANSHLIAAAIPTATGGIVTCTSA